jgi:ring-1,2-phenylacetyl-CoA epoxidase subunit PaaE
VLAREPKSFFTLIYGNRGLTSVIFREALEDLKSRYLGRLQLIHVFSREQQQAPLLNGRITPDKIRQLATTLINIPSYDEVFVCGPELMALAARETLLELGVKATHVHVELFGSHATPAPRSARSETGDRRQLTFILNGIKTDISAHPDDSVLQAGQVAGLELPFSCKGGVCAPSRWMSTTRWSHGKRTPDSYSRASPTRPPPSS